MEDWGCVMDAGDKLYAHGTTTCMILRSASAKNELAKKIRHALS